MSPIDLERPFALQPIQSSNKKQSTSSTNKENISISTPPSKRKTYDQGIQTLTRRNLENSYLPERYSTPQRITKKVCHPPIQEFEHEKAKQMRKLVSVKHKSSRRKLDFHFKSLSLDSSNPSSSSTTTSTTSSQSFLPFPSQALHSQKFSPTHWNTTIVNPELVIITKKIRKLAPQQSIQELPYLKLLPSSQFQINSEKNEQTDDSTMHSCDIEPPSSDTEPPSLPSPGTILNFMRSPTPPTESETSPTKETLVPTLKFSSDKEQPSVISPKKISLCALQIPPRGNKESEIVPIK